MYMELKHGQFGAEILAEIIDTFARYDVAVIIQPVQEGSTERLDTLKMLIRAKNVVSDEP